MPQIKVERSYAQTIFENTAGVEVIFVDHAGLQRESIIRLRVDMHGELTLECTEGRLVIRPIGDNNIALDVE